MSKPPSSNAHFALYPELVERSDIEFNLLMDQISLDPGRLKEVNEFLTSHLLGIRFNTLVDLDEVGALWEQIRESEYITDLLLDHTTALRIHADTLQAQGWEQLVQTIAQAWGAFNTTEVSEEHSVVLYSKETERFLTAPKALALIKGNPWLVSLYLMRTTEHMRTLLKVAAEAAAARWATAQAAGEAS